MEALTRHISAHRRSSVCPIPMDTKESRVLDSKSSWRPTSLRPLPLVLLAMLTVGLFIILEYFRQKSKAEKGLYFLNDPEDNGKLVTFLTNILPAAIAVIYSNMWLVIDLDVKRIEPYYQIAQEQPPLHVLFMDYAFDYMLSVPLKAFRNRHWLVMVVSFLNIIITLILPPMWNSLLSMVPLERDANIVLSTFDLLPVTNGSQESSSFRGADILSLTHSISNLGAALPSFTTLEYSIPPVDLSRHDLQNRDSVIHIETPVYWANPSCSDLPSFPLEFSKTAEFSIDSCNNSTQNLLDSYSKLTTEGSNWNSSGFCETHVHIHVPFDQNLYSQPRFQPLLGSPSGVYGERNLVAYLSTNMTSRSGCLKNITSNKIVAALVRIDQHDETVNANYRADDKLRYTATAISALCSISYFRGIADVYFSASNGSISQVLLKFNSTESLSPNQFNQYNFEDDLFGPGRGSRQYNRFSDINTQTTLPVITADNLATIAQHRMINDLSMDPLDWTSALESTVRLSFVLTLQKYFVIPRPPVYVKGHFQGSVFALQITPQIAILSEIVLIAAAITSMTMILIYRRRQMHIRSDPDSIAAMCSLFASVSCQETRLTSLVGNLETCSTLSLLKETHQFRLTETHINQWSISTAKLVTGAWSEFFKRYHSCQMRRLSFQSVSVIDANTDRPERYSSIFHTGPAFSSVGTLIVVIAVCILALRFGEGNLGIDFLVTASPFVGQLIWSFAPGFVSTLLSSFWITIYRDLSVLEPWIKLSRGRMCARYSLSLRYAAWTPYTGLIDSLCLKHYIIALVAIAWQSTNVLSITMGGLFSVGTKDILTQINIQPEFQLSLAWNDTLPQIEPSFQLLRTNISERTPLPTWTSSRFSFIPLSVGNASSNAGQTYRTKAIGIGASLDCKNYEISGMVLNDPRGAWNYTIPSELGQSSISCSIWFSPEWRPETYMAQSIYFWAPQSLSQVEPYEIPTLGPGYDEIDLSTSRYQSTSLQQNNATTCNDLNTLAFAVGDNNECRSRSVLVMARFARDNHKIYGSEDDISRTALLCQPVINAVPFEVDVDSDGRIISQKMLSESIDETKYSGLDNLLASYHLAFMDATERSRQSRKSYMPFDWPSLLLARLNWDQSPEKRLSDSVVLETYSKEVYERVFSTWFSLNRDIFIRPLSSRSSQPAILITKELRWIPSRPLFAITISLLVLYIPIIAIVYHKRRRAFSGPRMPKSIGSIIPWIAHSRMLEDFKGTSHLTDRELDGYLTRLGREYSFGWFKDAKGKRRFGLEFSEFVDEDTIEGTNGCHKIGSTVNHATLDFLKKTQARSTVSSLSDRFSDRSRESLVSSDFTFRE